MNADEFIEGLKEIEIKFIKDCIRLNVPIDDYISGELFIGTKLEGEYINEPSELAKLLPNI